MSPVSLGAARTKKDALISSTIARPHLPSLVRLPLGVTKHCREILGLTAPWEGHRLSDLFASLNRAGIGWHDITKI